MVELLACIRDPDEVAAVLAAGFHGVVSEKPVRVPRRPGTLAGTISDSTLRLDSERGGERLRLFVDRYPTEGEIVALDGWSGVLVRTHGHLSETISLPGLAIAVAAIRARGLRVALAGGLEQADVPRLLVLQPDLLIFGRALREGSHLDPSRLRAVATLAGRGVADQVPVNAAHTTARDRIFVRDLVLQLPVGVYSSEYGRTQRVRFAVEAELEPVGRATKDLGDTVSYDLLTDTIGRLTARGHVGLVETLAEEIAALVLAIPRIVLVRVRIEKLDVGPGVVGIDIERVRHSGAVQP